jgi:hypothetical protein
VSRRSERERVLGIVQGLGLFGAVVDGAVTTLGGQSPVAGVLSGGLTGIGGVRSRLADGYRYRFLVTIYILCQPGSEAATEDTLDTLVEAVAAALIGGGFGDVESDAAAEGAPLRIIDGKLYRAERLAVTSQEMI